MKKLPQKVQNWIKNNYCPQRLILSGENAFEIALNIAENYQKLDKNKISSGLSPDCLILKDEGKSFKMGNSQKPEKESVRGLINWISQSPVLPYRLVILENFERTSRDAPHALLKILEEPPAKAFFIFTTKNHYKALPTILSRMTVLPIPITEKNIPENPEAQNFLENKDIINKFQFIDALDKKIKKETSKQSLQKFLSDLLQISRIEPQFQNHLPLVLKAEQLIKKNINTKLVLENLALEITQQ